jgi:copper chaperone CopZ
MGDNRASFTVPGVASEDEAGLIREELEELNGVREATVDVDTGEATVRYGDELLSEEEIKRSIRNVGYEVE